MELETRQNTLEVSTPPRKIYNEDLMIGGLVRSIEVNANPMNTKFFVRVAVIKLDDLGFLQENHLVLNISKKQYDSIKKDRNTRN